jgi:hypothetical protein
MISKETIIILQNQHMTDRQQYVSVTQITHVVSFIKMDIIFKIEVICWEKL